MNGNPLFAVGVLMLLIAVLTAVVGVFVVGARDVDEYGGSAMDVRFDRLDEELTVLVMDRKDADRVDVTLTGWGDTVVVRLNETGSRVVLSEHRVVVVGGTVDAVASTALEDGRLVRPPGDHDTITVRVVGVAGETTKVLRQERGSI